MRSNSRSTNYSDHSSARGDYITAAEIEDDEPVDMTIERFEYEDLRDKDGRTVERIVLYFEDDTRGLPVSKTRGASLKKLFGDDMSQWCGERVTLFTVDTPMGPGVRIRAAKPAKKSAKPSRDRDDEDDRRPAKKPVRRPRTEEDEDEE